MDSAEHRRNKESSKEDNRTLIRREIPRIERIGSLFICDVFTLDASRHLKEWFEWDRDYVQPNHSPHCLDCVSHSSPECGRQPFRSPCCTLEHRTTIGVSLVLVFSCPFTGFTFCHRLNPFLVHRYSTPHIKRLVPPEPIRYEIQNGKSKGYKLEFRDWKTFHSTCNDLHQEPSRLENYDPLRQYVAFTFVLYT